MLDFRHGDVGTELLRVAENSFDACLTDPPYGLGFMGKAWDHGVPSVDVWREVYRVLKPGAMLMAFGGTRTWHRLACAIEDAGFELRDTMMWLYGSGFPKSLDISKAIDKTAGVKREVIGPNPNSITVPATDAAKLWSGYGTALKPAWEPVLLAMKPCEGTYAENALKWGVAGLAIDAGRINNPGPHGTAGRKKFGGFSGADGDRFLGGDICAHKSPPNPEGRWPANPLLDEEAAAMLDEQSGDLHGHGSKRHHGSDKGLFPWGTADRPQTGGESGGASRFFYCAKASRRERGEGNNHPTVKPLALCEYLARLILPPARDTPRRLVVPFAGSGSECLAADKVGWDEVVGIECELAYVEIAQRRTSKGDSNG